MEFGIEAGPRNVMRNEPLWAYFDTNVYDNLLKKTQDVTADDESRLRSAISSYKLVILPGIVTIDETCANRKRPDLIVPQLKLILSLCDWDRVVKPHDMMVVQDIKHFAYDGAPSHPFIHGIERGRIVDGLQRLIAEGGNLEELRCLLLEAQPQKKAFSRSILAIKTETQDEFSKAAAAEGISTYEEYFNRESGIVAALFAEYVENTTHIPGLVERCAARGMRDFLKLRSIRMLVGATLSYIWSNNFDRWKVAPSDTGDLHHCIPAAVAADVLVTHDPDFANLIRRVPIRGLRVMRLKELLDEVA